MKRLWYNLHIHCKFQIFQKLQATAAFLFGLLLGDIGIFYKFIHINCIVMILICSSKSKNEFITRVNHSLSKS